MAPPMSYMPRAVTRVMMPLIGLAVPPMRGLVENLYVFYEPYVVDHSAYAAAFGDDATPLREAIRQTVAWARSNPERKPVPSPQAGDAFRDARKHNTMIWNKTMPGPRR